MSQAIQIFDDFGFWDLVGTVKPVYETWLEYPSYTQSSSSTTRLNFKGNIKDARSYAYLRVRYEITGDSLFGEWQRIYPKKEREILLYPHPIEFNANTIKPRIYWQIQKRHWERKKIGSAPDTEWELQIEVNSKQVTDIPSQAETESLILGLF
ncbi:MAG: hypothetical protein AB4372_40675 [Xenococcus sp. (in: cyanobacteria)]